MGPFSAIKAEGALLADGRTTSCVCPFCHGGRNDDRSFSITREGMNLLYMCHRATCARKGRVFLGALPENNSHATPASFTPRIFDTPTRILTEEEAGILWDRYRLGYPDINRYGLRATISDTPRLVVPVRSISGAIRGYETRWLVPQGGQGKGAKTLHYRHIDEPWMGWFFNPGVFRGAPPKKTVVLVEDVLSAIKVSRQFVCVSLMGSHLSDAHVTELAKMCRGFEIVLALDRDAADKAVKFVKRYNVILPELVAIFIEKDMKYMNDDEIYDKVWRRSHEP